MSLRENVEGFSYAVVVAAIIASVVSACKEVEAPVVQPSSPDHIVLLHFNDLHGALEQASEIACVVQRARKECEQEGCHVVVTNGGDLFGNTSVSEKFKGKAEVDFVNALGVDALVPGNHDADYGSEVLEERMRQGKNWVTANLTGEDTGKGLLPPYVVVKAGNTRVGIEGLTFPRKSKVGSFFDDPVGTAKELMPALERESDIQIAIAHLDNPGEREIAEQVPGFDAVLGGHDHVSSSDYCDKTSVVPVCETPPDGKYVARVDMFVDGKKVVNVVQSLIPTEGCADADDTVSGVLKPYMDAVEDMNQVIGFAKEDFPNNRDGKDGQNGANNFVAKVMRGSTGAEFAMINATGVRSDIPAGSITGEHIVRLVFDDGIVVIELTGAEIKDVMEAFLARDRYFALAGFTYQTQLDPNKVYRVATTGFLTDGKGPFRKAKVVAEGRPLREAITDYFKDCVSVSP